ELGLDPLEGERLALDITVDGGDVQFHRAKDPALQVRCHPESPGDLPLCQPLRRTRRTATRQFGTHAPASDTFHAVRPSLKKALGQHHLIDSALCRPLIRFLEPAGQRVLEIGPGGGVLTTALLDAEARVLGWELDLAWAAFLRRRFPSDALSLVVGDALEIA